MADCILMQAGGGGLDPDELTATAGDVLKGKIAGVAGNDDPVAGMLELTGTAADSQVLSGQTYYNTDAKTKRTGTQINRGAWTGSVGMNGSVTVPAGFHNGGGAVSGPAVTQRGAWASSVGRNGRVTVPEGYHNGAGYVNGPVVTERGAWASSVGRNGRITIPEGYHNGSGYVNGPTMTDLGARTYTPGRSNQSIAAGYYLTGAQTIAGDANLVAGNIRKNVTIFGVRGTFQGYADSPLYLFSNGKWSNLQTTGAAEIAQSSGKFFIGRITAGGNIVAGICTDAITPDAWVLGRLNQKVNLSAYNYIRIISTIVQPLNGGYCILGISTNAYLTSPSFSASTRFSNSSDVLVDISAITGDYYIYFYAAAARSETISLYLTTV